MLPIVLWGCLMKTLWPLNEIVESFPFIVYHQEAALRFGSCLHEHKLARSEVWFQIISWQSAFETSINPYYHIKYSLVCDVCFYTCKHSYWQINKVCKKQRQKKTILKRFGRKQDITTYQNRWEFERCGLRMVVPSAAGVRAHVACNSCEPDRSNYSP